MPKVADKPTKADRDAAMVPRLGNTPEVAEPTKRRGTPPGSIGSPQQSGHCEIAGRVELGVVASNKTAEELHRTCKGAITNGVGTTWLCSCPCHADRLYCHRCGFDHTENPAGFRIDRRQCIDATDCADKIRSDFAELSRTDPFLVQVGEIRKEVDAMRAVEAAEKAAKRRVEAERAREAGEEPETREEPTKRPGKATKGEPQRCHEGCGGVTKGGRFLMGHDMKLKGQLFEAARGKSPDDDEALRAAREIRARGWSEAGFTQEMLDTLRHASMNEVDVIRFAVERRYA